MLEHLQLVGVGLLMIGQEGRLPALAIFSDSFCANLQFVSSATVLSEVSIELQK